MSWAIKGTLIDATRFLDEPLVHQNDPQLLALCKMAKQKVTVLLSGEGADELMGGYVRYKPLQKNALLKLMRPLLGLLASRGGRIKKLYDYFNIENEGHRILLNANTIYPQYFKKFGINFNWNKFEFRNELLEEARSIYPTDKARQAMYCDMYIHMNSVLDR
ncbi:MAG: asparagine synthase-related protein, partial [Owenweeksia sp.]